MADVAVSELIERYGCKKTHFYQVRISAMKAAIGIEPFKRGGNKSYISEDGVKFLDSLNEWILENGSDVERFLYERYGIGEESSRIKLTVKGSEPLNQFLLMAEAFQGLQQPKSILENYRELEECARNSWQIPTSKLAALMELTP
ncbi:MAG: hypothetical protein KME18_28065 [Phormidium tanganyikae FI6-MK23]|jgi:hypothetical protein|nr:hypothetical protein [Phormidium tanganyikae FI6-MK23]